MPQIKNKTKRPRVPKGWLISGANPTKFDAEIDKSDSHSGTRCAHMLHNDSLKSSSAWGTLMQQMSPLGFLDKRVRMSLWAKTKNVTSWASPWMRVDGRSADDMLSFDNMCERRVK